MKSESERLMLEEVALRNAIAKFRSENASRHKKASIPKVGIFWIDSTGRMYAEGVSLRDAEDYGDFRTFEGSHYELWRKAVSENPEWRDREYDEVPRGRVVYKKDPKKPEFIVYMPKQINKFKNKVFSWFSLPTGHVRFDFSDEHYRME